MSRNPENLATSKYERSIRTRIIAFGGACVIAVGFIAAEIKSRFCDNPNQSPKTTAQAETNSYSDNFPKAEDTIGPQPAPAPDYFEKLKTPPPTPSTEIPNPTPDTSICRINLQ